MSKTSHRTISVVAPMLNEEETAHAFLTELTHQASTWEVDAYEIIIVDDGSTDSTPSILSAWEQRTPQLRVLTFSRNFGHQAAITAGIEAAGGDCVVVMDSDLQDPPDLIPEMISAWRSGTDVVYAVRRSRDGETWIKKSLAALFYRSLAALSDTHIPTDTGDFRLMSRPVVDALNSMPERDRYVRGMVAWTGFNQAPLHFDRAERHAGKPKYSFTKSLKLGVAGVLGFSDKPLYITIWIGLAAMALAVLGLLWVVISSIAGWGEQLRGWTSLSVLILFFSAVQLIFLGIVGLYISRIFLESKHRPIYLVMDDSGTVLQPSNQERSEGGSS